MNNNEENRPAKDECLVVPMRLPETMLSILQKKADKAGVPLNDFIVALIIVAGDHMKRESNTLNNQVERKREDEN